MPPAQPLADIHTPDPQLKRVFVVGCPRSGTTWTTLLLDQHPDVAAFHHSKFFHYMRSLEHWWQKRDGGQKERIAVAALDEQATGTTEARDRPKMELKRAISEEKLYEFCRTFATEVFDEVASFKPGAQVVVDKTPENVRLSPFILKLFPDAYFLHVIRDPRSVFCSLRSADSSWAGKGFATKPIDGGKFWSSEVETGLQIAGATSRYREVRYEVLSEDGPGELERIFAWLDLPTKPGFCEEAVAACDIDSLRQNSTMPSDFFRTGAKDSWRQELSSRDVRMIEYVAHDLMERLGYEPTLKPFRYKPIRVRLQDGLERILSSADHSLNRVTRGLLWRWRGREVDIPELVIRV